MPCWSGFVVKKPNGKILCMVLIDEQIFCRSFIC